MAVVLVPVKVMVCWQFDELNEWLTPMLLFAQQAPIQVFVGVVIVEHESLKSTTRLNSIFPDGLVNGTEYVFHVPDPTGLHSTISDVTWLTIVPVFVRVNWQVVPLNEQDTSGILLMQQVPEHV